MSNPQKATSKYQPSCDKSDRVRRACDRCNISRTRCSELNYSCEYQRTAKKRGPKPKSARRASESGSPSDNIPKAFPSRESTTSWDSADIRAPLSIFTTSDSDREGWTTYKEELLSPVSVTPDAYSSFGNSYSQLSLVDAPAWECPNLLNYGRFPIDLSPLATGNPSDSKTSCRYSCLNAILPLLKGTLAPRDACDLLDIFFAGEDTIGTTAGCPYVLSPVIRRKSLLSSLNPRPVSSALLAIMLWSVSHTANLQIFQDSTARNRVTQRLYFLSMQLLKVRDGDSWHRVSDGWVLDDTISSCISPIDGYPQHAYTEKAEQNVDDVISFVLLACVISGSDFKNECHKWWNKAVMLVKKLGLNSEARITENTPSSQQMSLPAREEHEECRRAFWLVYALDRHLALYFNEPLRIHDYECQVLHPLPEWIWQNLDVVPVEDLPPRAWGPATHISGTGFFEYFLPLMVILGDIIEVRSRVEHPRLGSFAEAHMISSIETALANCEYNLEILRLVQKPPDNTQPSDLSLQDRIELVIAYCQYIIRVLHILLYSKWDAVLFPDDNNGWLASPEFLACTSNSLAAGEFVSRILERDKDMSFIPFLFGIYLVHGSITFLVLSDRMTQTGPGPSIQQACEVSIRALEISVMTFDTAFQVRF
ncbi:hypothetical protein BJY01DRAFT_259496 [Aspergillus pseudoustus]|uniref:Xylanolytic transcriptional activator xlnR n=1 Tax=Aspergillus pseudoustus TaxID=1810923 RepID=A0ABR4J496_9EURO